MGFLVARTAACLIAVVALLATPAAAGEPQLAALFEDGTLVVFRCGEPTSARTVTLKGLLGQLIGIDRRPADDLVYGVANGADVYRIDLASGNATLVSTLTVPFDGGVRSGFDFNPQADRLRLVSADGRNLRVNVTLGATAVDAALAFATDDPNAGHRPHIAGSAYTNNRRDVATTRLLEVDSALDVLVVQDPPNDGVLRTVGPLGVDIGALAGFDIVTDADGRDRAFLGAGRGLYTVDLGTGRATPAGDIPGSGSPVVSLTALADTPPPGHEP